MRKQAPLPPRPAHWLALVLLVTALSWVVASLLTVPAAASTPC